MYILRVYSYPMFIIKEKLSFLSIDDAFKEFWIWNDKGFMVELTDANGFVLMRSNPQT